MANFTSLLHGQAFKDIETNTVCMIRRYGITTMSGWIIGALLVALLFPALFDFIHEPALPVINKGRWEFSDNAAKKRYVTSARDLIVQGEKKFKGPFVLITDHGRRVILPPSYIESVDQEPRLTFMDSLKVQYLGHLPGFDGVRSPAPNQLLENVIRLRLTQSFTNSTQTLSEELSPFLQELWGDETEWTSVNVCNDVIKLVVRLAAMSFVGSKLAHDAEWQRISASYGVNLFRAVQDVKRWPPALHRVAVYLEPRGRLIMADSRKARIIIESLIAARRAEKAAALANGEPEPQYNDTVEWCQEFAGGAAFDPVQCQLSLGDVTIHTTSDLICQALYNICTHPQIVRPLRDEAISVLGSKDWNKAALHQLQLLDSVLKETLRVKPPFMTFMNRVALEDCVVNGDQGPIKLRKWQLLGFSNERMWSDNIYENAETFDPYRFLQRRKVPGLEFKSHLVSTSLDHTAFSYGKLVCPGRFFAANMAKVVLVHILLKYDFRLKEGTSVAPFAHGTTLLCNPSTMVEIRRRKEEISL